ncbi:DUF1656 domain-containing protein [Cupriavidus sp. YAF13]|uniref:DUF1656 domain-containing protein n=1 Tax=Cupriavidus sp. YAF13 TaxID=3233075 RepID=UPI003F9332E0
MLSDISIGGVFLPRLLVSTCVAFVLMALSSRLLAALGLYRIFVSPPLVNISLCSIWLGLSVWFVYAN